MEYVKEKATATRHQRGETVVDCDSYTSSVGDSDFLESTDEYSDGESIRPDDSEDDIRAMAMARNVTIVRGF